jgi:hypothetical protein
MACVPVQLTSVAATENMPIQVYILGEARAVPLNFVELELDDTQVDWVGCLGNPTCYDDDYRLRFNTAASQLVNQSFVTEFAGSSVVMDNAVAIPVSQDQIAQVASSDEFFRLYRGQLPDLPIVDTIVQDYIPPPEGTAFDAAGLAQELEQAVLKPAREAQAFVDSFSYLTRLYARLGPESMTKDPFFAFKPEMPTVSNVHSATAIPVCNADGVEPSALSITVDSGGTVQVPAVLGCIG